MSHWCRGKTTRIKFPPLGYNYRRNQKNNRRLVVIPWTLAVPHPTVMGNRKILLPLPWPVSRISLLDLNQALEEMEQLCQEHQLAAQQWRRKQSSKKNNSSSVASMAALQRRQEFLQKRQQPFLASIDDATIAVWNENVAKL